MSAYRKIVVGTDGSDRARRAEDRAAAIAADTGATLVLVCAYHPASEHVLQGATEVLGKEAFLVAGSTPAERTLRDAAERARQRFVADIDTVAVEGDASDALVKVVHDSGADLLVVGNRGLNTLAGRLLGSVPSEVARNAGCDVLIVRTEV